MTKPTRWTAAARGVALPDGAIAPAIVVVEGERIAEVRSLAPGQEGEPPGPPGEAIRLADGVLAPGFVDLQLNGAFGHDFATDGAAGIRAVAERLPAHGVTAFLPTFVTAPLDELVTAVGLVAELLGEAAAPGARVLGAHVEGPFLSPQQPGAHPPAHIRDPDPEAVARLAAAAPGALRLVTLAPERPGALAAIAALRAAGAVVAIGHSDATAAQVAAAADAGVTCVTHLYNAQRGLHHREPGVVGRALVDERLTLGLIADLEHVAPDALRIAFGVAGRRVALVSDGIAAAGMNAGRFRLAGREVEAGPGHAPRLLDGGGLAGSALTLDVAVANVTRLGIPLADALRAATLTPAAAIGADDCGRIAPGARADLVWLGDDLRVRATWVGGRLVHGASAAGRMRAHRRQPG